MDVYSKVRLGSHLQFSSSSSSTYSCHLLASPALSSNRFVPTTSVTLTIIPSLARLHHFFITSSHLHHLVVAKPFFSHSPDLSSSLLSHYLCLFSLTSLSAHSCRITLITLPYHPHHLVLAAITSHPQRQVLHKKPRRPVSSQHDALAPSSRPLRAYKGGGLLDSQMRGGGKHEGAKPASC